MAPNEKTAYRLVVAVDQQKHEPSVLEAPRGFGVRHTQALVLFFCLAVGFMMRAHLSVTLVAMTNGTAPDHGHSPNSTLGVFIHNNTMSDQPETDTWTVYRTYNWTKSSQEIIIFSFFVGYTSMMVPMGMAAQRLGGKLPIVFAMLVNGIVSTLTPWMPLLGGWVAVAVCRLLQGMTQACFYPSMHTLLAQWAPLAERGRLSTYVYTGSQLGTVVAFQMAGALAGGAAGWPAIFWLCGALSLVSCALLATLGAASPRHHATISHRERLYILGEHADHDHAPKRRRTPWRRIATCPAVWGLIAAHAGSAVGYLFVLTQTPVYMDRILGVNIKTNGLYSSLPYVAMYFMTLAFGAAADVCANRGYLRIVTIRRLANTIGLVVAGVFLILFAYARQTLPAVLLLVLCMAMHSGVHVGFHINHIDLAPNFAGPMMSLGNTLANVAGLGVPALVASLVRDTGDQSQWQTAFIVVAAIQMATNGVYVVLARGDVQPWNEDGADDSHEAVLDQCQQKKPKSG